MLTPQRPRPVAASDRRPGSGNTEQEPPEDGRPIATFSCQKPLAAPPVPHPFRRVSRPLRRPTHDRAEIALLEAALAAIHSQDPFDLFAPPPGLPHPPPPPPSRLLGLPVELLLAILPHCDTTTLYRLSLSCRTLNVLAKSALLKGALRIPAFYPQGVSFHEAIARSSAHQPLARITHLACRQWGPWTPFFCSVRGCPTLVSAELGCARKHVLDGLKKIAPNIKELTLFEPELPISSHDAIDLPVSRFPAVTKLVMSAWDGPQSPSSARTFLNLYLSFPNLVTLHLINNFCGFGAPDARVMRPGWLLFLDHLPHLRHLKLCIRARSLLPSFSAHLRRLRTLHLAVHTPSTHLQTVNEVPIPGLFEDVHPDLETLDYSPSEDPSPLLALFASIVTGGFPSLRAITISLSEQCDSWMVDLPRPDTHEVRRAAEATGYWIEPQDGHWLMQRVLD